MPTKPDYSHPSQKTTIVEMTKPRGNNVIGHVGKRWLPSSVDFFQRNLPSTCHTSRLQHFNLKHSLMGWFGMVDEVSYWTFHRRLAHRHEPPSLSPIKSMCWKTLTFKRLFALSRFICPEIGKFYFNI